MTAAPALVLPVHTTRGRTSPARSFALNVSRGLFFCLLFSIIFAPEFSREGVATAGSIIYSKAIGGFRFIDLAIIILAFLHILCLCCLRRTRLSFPRSLVVPGMAFLVCITSAIGYGISRGGSNFFFDWRGLALGVSMYVVWASWLQSSDDVAFAIAVFATYMAMRVGFLYLLYAAGYRDTLLGVTVPVFDGPVLSGIVFVALLALSCQDGAQNQRQRFRALCLAAAASVMVLLSMRRTYWGELGIGLLILLILGKRHRLRSLIVMGAALVVAATVLGTNFSSRVRSFDLTRNDTQFSADNADHLYDLIDAWDEVRQSPLMGIGLGTSYTTWHIRNWKPESVMVHNAPLHVWLKYGMGGVLCYFWFHLALLRWLYLSVRARGGVHRGFLSAAFAYLAAQFLVTLGFAPWPYSELQLTVLMSFILAAVVAANRHSVYALHDASFAVRHHALL